MLPGAYDSPKPRAAFTALLLEQQAAPTQAAVPDRAGLAPSAIQGFGYGVRTMDGYLRPPGDFEGGLTDGMDSPSG
jgi:hypothetical protein